MSEKPKRNSYQVAIFTVLESFVLMLFPLDHVGRKGHWLAKPRMLPIP